MTDNISKQREHSFFGDVVKYFERAAKHTKHPEGLLSQIMGCNSVYRVKFPVRLKKRY